ncbi:Carbonic anhydrase [Artemisia annua]|uniref:Carbonic anhydrase n=1 Tax=Artemisia annua TaxID=35608 RepID=A0A2U1KTT4_ARTAN|nr:Carbonic anhydrase [Artemisia annua]
MKHMVLRCRYENEPEDTNQSGLENIMMLQGPELSMTFDPIERIIEGFNCFKINEFNKYPEYYCQLAEKQEPKYLMFACSDSRVSPTNIFNLRPGEAFMARNIGNMVPVYNQLRYSGVGAIIEYAITVLKDLGTDEITKEELLAQERLFAAHEEYQRSQALAEQEQAKLNAEVERVQATYVSTLPLERRKVLDAMAAEFDETDWMNIGAPIASNASLTRDLMGDNATTDDIVALLRKKKKEEDAKKLKAKLAKPPTQAELTHTMRVVVKNMSPAVFNSGWSKEKVWNMPHEKLLSYVAAKI